MAGRSWTIQPIGGTDTLAAQPDAHNSPYHGRNLVPEERKPPPLRPTSPRRISSLQPVVVQPVAQSYDDSVLDAFVQKTLHRQQHLQPVARRS